MKDGQCQNVQHVWNFVLNTIFIATGRREPFDRNRIEWNVIFITIACHLQVQTPYRPVEAKLEPLSAARDKLPNGRQINGLTLT